MKIKIIPQDEKIETVRFGDLPVKSVFVLSSNYDMSMYGNKLHLNDILMKCEAHYNFDNDDGMNSVGLYCGTIFSCDNNQKCILLDATLLVNEP